MIFVGSIVSRFSFEQACQCEICVAARINLRVTCGTKRGRPRLSSYDCKKPRSVNMCNRCMTETGKGKPHRCTKSQKHANALQLLNDNAINVGDSVVNSYIRERTSERQVTLPNLRGKHTSWAETSTAQPKHMMSVDDLLLIKSNCDLSTRNTIALSSTLRALDIPIAPNIRFNLTKHNKLLEHFFDVTYLPFDVNGDANIELKPVVYCKNVPNLIQFVCERRNIKEQDYFVKIGIDGGGGIMKITLSLVLKEDAEISKAGKKSFKSTGVKKLLLLAIIPGIPEKYWNIAPIWTTLLELNKVDSVVSGDLKIINLLLGIMGHSSSYPCPYCLTPRHCLSDRLDEPRTLTNIEKYSKQWKSSGADEKLAKKYFNCIQQPLLCGASNDEIIFICPPPALHITLGVINAIFKKVESLDADVAERWAKTSNSTRHSQYGFTGRNCHKLIEHRAILRLDGPIGLLRKV